MKIKRFFALMLALALSLTMLQGVAFGAKDDVFESDIKHGGATIKMTFKVLTESGNTGTVQVGNGITFVTAINTTASGALVIPSTIKNGDNIYTVTAIGHSAFYSCKALTSVDIPYTVTTIGQGAFRDCDALTSVDLRGATNLVKIEDMAFYLCDNLTSIIIPNSVTSMGEDVFDRCKKLTSVTLPNNLQKISEQMFQNCEALQQITIPAGVTLIEDEVFEDCTDLTTITFAGSKIATFGEDVLNNADRLANIYFEGDYDPANTPAMITALANALTGDGLNLGTMNINYNQNAKGWDPDGIAALTNAGFAPANIKPYIPTTPTGGSTGGGGSTGSAGAGAWYIGTGVPYTQIVDTPDTTAMLETGNVITVTGQSPTGIIVKFAPTALSGHSTVTINNSIQDVTLTAEQIANLVAKAEGSVIHITVKETADGVSISATAGGVQVTL